MQKEKKHYQWFIEPKGDFAHANWVINEYLGSSEVRATRNLRDKDGRPHDVWECSHAEVERLRPSQATVHAVFSIWNRPNNHSPIRLVDFIMPLGKKLKEAREKRRTFKTFPRGPVEPYAEKPLPL